MLVWCVVCVCVCVGGGEGEEHQPLPSSDKTLTGPQVNSFSIGSSLYCKPVHSCSKEE